MTRSAIRLVHWDADEAARLAGILESSGYVVDHSGLTPAGLRRLYEDPPAAMVIDLSRIPSRGRDLGVALRRRKGTRHVPLVFVGGESAKVARVRDLLPDAVFTAESDLVSAVRSALDSPPADPEVPSSAMAAYSGTPLLRKLGIREGSTVALLGAPEGFEATLGRLPAGARLVPEAEEPSDLTLWFVRSEQELGEQVRRMSPRASGGRLWIVWPKKSSPVPSDLTQVTVRRIGLSAGLVDFKIAAIDATWSGLRFTRRTAK